MGPGLERRIPTAAIANRGLSAINPTRARLVSKTRLTLDGRNLVAVEVIEAIFVGYLTLLGAGEAGRPATLKVHSPAELSLTLIVAEISFSRPPGARVSRPAARPWSQRPRVCRGRKRDGRPGTRAGAAAPAKTSRGC